MNRIVRNEGFRTKLSIFSSLPELTTTSRAYCRTSGEHSARGRWNCITITHRAAALQRGQGWRHGHRWLRYKMCIARQLQIARNISYLPIPHVPLNYPYKTKYMFAGTPTSKLRWPTWKRRWTPEQNLSSLRCSSTQIYTGTSARSI